MNDVQDTLHVALDRRDILTLGGLAERLCLSIQKHCLLLSTHQQSDLVRRGGIAHQQMANVNKRQWGECAHHHDFSAGQGDFPLLERDFQHIPQRQEIGSRVSTRARAWIGERVGVAAVLGQGAQRKYLLALLIDQPGMVCEATLWRSQLAYLYRQGIRLPKRRGAATRERHLATRCQGRRL